MPNEEADTTSERVRTYVPAYQKGEWAEHADSLDMSLSEFVRTMVQAGRSSFEPPAMDAEISEPAASPSSARDPQGTELEERVRSALSTEVYRTWDELLEAVYGDVEDDLESTLESLSEDDDIEFSHRHGGYALR